MNRSFSNESKETAYASEIIELQARLLKALSNPRRLRLLYALSIDKYKTFSELKELLSENKGNLSKHISILKDFGLVEVQYDGRCMKIRLSGSEIHEACSLVMSLIEKRIRSLGNELDKLSGKEFKDV